MYVPKEMSDRSLCQCVLEQDHPKFPSKSSVSSPSSTNIYVFPFKYRTPSFKDAYLHFTQNT